MTLVKCPRMEVSNVAPKSALIPPPTPPIIFYPNDPAPLPRVPKTPNTPPDFFYWAFVLAFTADFFLDYSAFLGFSGCVPGATLSTYPTAFYTAPIACYIISYPKAPWTSPPESHSFFAKPPTLSKKLLTIIINFIINAITKNNRLRSLLLGLIHEHGRKSPI